MSRSDQDGEVELKFDLDRRSARKVRRHPLLSGAGPETERLRSTYFDTAKGEIRDAGYSLRVRRDGDDFTQTVKSSGGAAGLFDRGEWEKPVASKEPDRKALRKTPLGKVGRKLEPVVCTDVKRTSWLIDHDGSAIDVVLDTAIVRAEGEKASFNELELELRDGEPTALFAVAQQLAEAMPLEIGVISKEERGHRLATGAFGDAQKASEPDIRKEMTVAQAFALIVQECVRQFRLNQPLIIADRDPRALHQARVAMRRLRTAFSLFAPAIRQGSIEPLATELRDFLRPFGEARNLDVFLAGHGEELSWRERRRLRAARSDAYDEVIGLLQSQSTRDMLLDLVEWTASGDWQKERASQPISKFAARRLDDRWRKVSRRASRLGDLEEHELHRLRIGIKKLRYSVEFLAALYKKKAVGKFASSLEKMQDCLGLMHDEMVSREIVADYSLQHGGRTDVVGRSRQLKAMDKRFKRLKRANRFWRR